MKTDKEKIEIAENALLELRDGIFNNIGEVDKLINETLKALNE